ncbi:MAG: hypothetical protein UHY68_09105 [Acutalibacteraceae bacterium]|nr:hypothetical protein [Acutalibacteraceae bacterium]
MNKKLKRITAILMSALIISSVATLTACTDTSDSDKNTATELSTEPLKSETEVSTKPTELPTSETEVSTEPTEAPTSKPKSTAETKSTAVPKFETKTESIAVLTPNNQDTSTEQTETLRANNEDGIYVQGVFPEDAKLYACFSNGYIESTIPLVISQYWYRSWFGVNNASPKFVHREFSVEVYSEADEYFPLDMKVFVPYDKPDCHIVYYDHEYNLKEIPSEYINGEYVFSMGQPDFKHGGNTYNFYIYTHGEPADPNAKPVQQTLTDEETGITVSGEIPPDTQLMVFDYSNKNTLGSNKVTTPGLYYIALVRGYKEIAPSTPLTVTIPGEASNKVGYYHPDKFNNNVMETIGSYKPEMADVNIEYIPVVDENDTTAELTYLESSYNNNRYTITTSQLGMFGIGTEDTLNPKYLCQIDQYAPT